MKQYVLVDGQFHLADEAQVPAKLLDSLLFREKMRAIRNAIPFWYKHLEIFGIKLKLLGQSIPPFLQYNGKELKRQVERMLVKNKLFKSALVDFYLFKTESGFSYLLKVDAMQSTSYELNEAGLTLGIFDKITKGTSPLSSFDLGSEPFWKLLHLAGKDEFDELILMNHDSSLLEAPGKNIYFLKGNDLFSPSPEMGAYCDVSQSTVQQICANVKLGFHFKDDLKEDFLLQSDEVFLVSSLDGIEWVKSYKNKRYHNKMVKLVNAEFNRLLIQ
jgi:branched-subunit amino acid aminotransferase/4-amino-4-deoxychorismate lyase